MWFPFPFPTFKFANEKNWNQVAPPAEEGHTYKFNKYLEAEGIWSFWSEAEAIDIAFSVKAFYDTDDGGITRQRMPVAMLWQESRHVSSTVENSNAL